MADIMEKLANRARVRVYKPAPNSDDRKKLEGEPLQKGVIKDTNGKDVEVHFFEIGAHRAQYINEAFRKYRVSEPFIPGMDDPDGVDIMGKPEPEGDFPCPEPGCGRVFKSQQALTAHSRSHK